MSDVDRIKEDIKKAKVHVKRAETLEKLMKNKDFKSIILEHYIKDQSLFLVRQKAQPVLQSDHDQKDLDREIMSVSHFSLFLKEIEAMGKQAKNSIVHHESELSVAMSEDLGEY